MEKTDERVKKGREEEEGMMLLVVVVEWMDGRKLVEGSLSTKIRALTIWIKKLFLEKKKQVKL